MTKLDRFSSASFPRFINGGMPSGEGAVIGNYWLNFHAEIEDAKQRSLWLSFEGKPTVMANLSALPRVSL